MDVIVQLAPAVAEAALAGSPQSPAAGAVVAALAGLGAALAPLHVGATDPTLRTYFRVEVADPAAGERVIAALLGLEGVQSVYLAPAATPPAGLP